MNFLHQVSKELIVRTSPPLPIRNEGLPVVNFLPGWRAIVVYSGFAPIHLLVLKHRRGEWALWFLDGEMNRVGGLFSDLPPDYGNALVRSCCSLFDGLWTKLVSSPFQTPLGDTQKALLALPLAIRKQLFNIYLERFNFNTEYEPFSDFSGLSGIGKVINLNTRRILLSHASLNHIFNPNTLQCAYVVLLQNGGFVWPSPIDGHELQVQHSYCLDANRYAYRMVDELHGLTFYLIAEEIHFRIACLYVPEAHLVLAHDPERAKSLMPDLGRAVFHHIVEHGMDLEKYLKAPAEKIVHVWRGATAMHLGHLLWNDLSGIGNLVKSIAAPRLPLFLIFDAAAEPEMYGALDRIFPELEGKIVREPGTLHKAIPSFYKQRYLLIKSTGMQVTREVQKRILSTLFSDPRNANCVGATRKARDRGLTILILGLRTENRTITNLSDFCDHLITFLAGLNKKLLIVVDGHNSMSCRSDQFFKSHGEHSATRSPIVIEHEIAASIKKLTSDTTIQVVSTVGCPLAHSLIWCAAAQFFVAFWGAGLAKYRWVCNKPGLVITSRWNLENLGDLHLYDSPLSLENPSPIEFIDPSAVFDMPDAPLNVQLGATHIPSIMNFDLNESAVFDALEGLMKRFT